MTVERHPMVARTLSTGVLLSFGLLLLGLIESFVQRGASGIPDVSEIIPGVVRGDPSATVTAGLLVLMLTPLMRVIVLAFEFVRNRETPFAMISIGVLFLLAVTIAISFA